MSEAESARSASDVTRPTPGQQGSSVVPDIDRRLCYLVAAVDRLQSAQARALAIQAGMAADLAALRLSLEGKTRRDALLRDLAGYLDLGCSTWAAANAIALILTGVRRPPAEAESTTLALAGTQLSARQIQRILQAGRTRESADKSAALCQWLQPRDHRSSSDDEDDENACQ